MYACNDFFFPGYDLCRVKILRSYDRNFFVDDNKKKKERRKRKGDEKKCLLGYRYQFALRLYSNNLI